MCTSDRVVAPPYVFYFPIRYLRNTVCRERDSTTGYQNDLLGNEPETGRAVRFTIRGTRSNLRAKRHTAVLASRSSRFDPPYGWFDSQFAFLGERRLTRPSIWIRFIFRQLRTNRTTDSRANWKIELPMSTDTTSSVR